MRIRRWIATWFVVSFVPLLFPRVNPALRWFLKSRLHWLASRYVVLLIVPGRRTGRIYEIPIAFHRDGRGHLEALTSPVGNWWKNLRDLAEISVVYRGRRQIVRVELVEHDLELKARALARRDLCRRIFTPLPPEQTVLVRIADPQSQAVTGRGRS